MGEFESIGKVGGAWRAGWWKGRASKRCSGKGYLDSECLNLPAI